MTRPLWLLAVVGCLVGCQGPQPTINPFHGHTTIPPVPTRQGVPAQAQPYYNSPGPPGSPPFQSGAPGTGQMPANTTIPSTSAPGGTYQYPGGSASRTDTASGHAQLASHTGPVSSSGWTRAGHSSGSSQAHATAITSVSSPSISGTTGGAIRIPTDTLPNAGFIRPSPTISPASRTAAATNATNHIGVAPANRIASTQNLPQPGRIVVPTDAVEITDLPRAAGSRGSSVRSQPAVRPATFVDRSAATSTGSSAISTSATTPQRRYQHTPDYQQLAGKLEYLRTTNEWKLRYIPIDGRTDEYGGSVLIVNPEAVGQLASGDFVKVEGTISQPTDDEPSFAPTYQIQRIRPLSM